MQELRIALGLLAGGAHRDEVALLVALAVVVVPEVVDGDRVSQGGDAIKFAQQNMVHASLATTTICVTTEAKRRMRAVQRFWAK